MILKVENKKRRANLSIYTPRRREKCLALTQKNVFIDKFT